MLLPVDLLVRVRDLDKRMPGTKAGDYHLPGRQTPSEAAAAAWSNCQAAWSEFRQKSDRLPANGSGTTVTRNEWLLPLFRELGYGQLQSKPAITIDEREYHVSHGWEDHVPIHLMSSRYDLDRRTPGVNGAARQSPYSMMQEMLNRSRQHRWGFVSNGRKLYVLRDNISLARASNVEFDLESMMEGNVYQDFMTLFLLCHQSRVEILPDEQGEADRQSPENCWLERWTKLIESQGVEAREKMRHGVEAAINTLGAGFLTTRGNRSLRQRMGDADDPFDKQHFYRQLLRMVYRLILLFVAEEKRTEDGDNLLHPTDTTPEARQRYQRYYSVSRLRVLATVRRGTSHTDLYESLKVLFMGLRNAYEPLGIPALGSMIFSDRATPDLDDAVLSNEALLQCIRQLAFTVDSEARRPVDFGNLGAEELGSIYESLLDLHPVIDSEEGPFRLAKAAGSERKTTGSYYTPSSLVNCLLDSALEPVVERAKQQPDPEAALLELKVCDPACGSGHFLIAAADRIATHLARVRTEDEQPSTLMIQRAKRDVIGRCIYGVDIKPMTVELCKVSLWMEALQPGKPLGFLDHHIQCGNSLLGTTPELLENGIPNEAFKAIEGDDKAVVRDLKSENKKYRTGYAKEQRETQQDLFLKPMYKLGNLTKVFAQLSVDTDDTVEAIAEKERLYASLVSGAEYQNARLLADTWCAVFVWKKDDSELGGLCPIESDFRRIESNPHSVLPHVKDEIRRLARQYQFFHWHLAFPDVFVLPEEAGQAENEQTGWSRGFDVVLGNPPWERVKLQEKEWFAARDEQIAKAPNASKRKRLIESLRDHDPSLYSSFLDARRQSEGVSQFLRQSTRYPLCGRGDVNTYTVFTEHFRNCLSPTGKSGIIVPSGIATDDTTKFFFRSIVEDNNLVSLFDFENRAKLFGDVDSRMKFSLLTVSGTGSIQQAATFGFFLHRVEELEDRDRVFKLTSEDIALVNPNTRTCPIFRTRRDAELTKTIYRRVPVLIDESKGDAGNPWGVKFNTMFHMSNDSHLFLTVEELEASGPSIGNNRRDYVPLYEAKMFFHFDHRFASADSGLKSATLPKTTTEQKLTATYSTSARFVVPRSEVTSKLSNWWSKEWVIAYRWITNATNERTFISTIVPASGFGNSAPLIFTGDVPAISVSAFFSAVNSFAFDYVVRQKIGGTNMTFGLAQQLPCFLESAFYQRCKWRRNANRLKFLIPRVLELTYTAWDLEAFALDCGYDGPPFRWDEHRRFLLRCELDAAYFHLYLGAAEAWGADNPELREMFPTPRDAVDYIMETFPIVKRKDIARTEIKDDSCTVTTEGTYITKETILQIYDQMQQAIESGKPYETQLDPPPRPPTDPHRNFVPMSQWKTSDWPTHIHQPR